MSVEILHPFQLASDGSIAVTTDPNVQTQQHIMSIISTSPGERVMVPNYGVSVRGTVFLPDEDSAVAQLQTEVAAAIATYEPNVTVKGVDLVETDDPEDPIAISVSWEIKSIQTGSASGVMTGTILIGGTVVESGVNQ